MQVQEARAQLSYCMRTAQACPSTTQNSGVTVWKEASLSKLVLKYATDQQAARLEAAA